MAHPIPMAQRCSAHNRQGDRCGHRAMQAQKVCRFHGGKAPLALAKAEDRLRALVHPAITGLQQLIAHADSDSVKLSAIKDVLDRTGFRAAEQQADLASSVMRVTIAFDHATHADDPETPSLPYPD